jgi:hypothetical protein
MSITVGTQQVKVTCIRVKTYNASGYESITHIGGAGWIWDKERAIRELESPTPSYSFHTLVNGKRAEVGVFERDGQKYLRTYADGYWNNNLEALPLCG